MADFDKTEKKIEEEEETKYEEQNLVTSHHLSSPHEPHTWLLITDGEKGCERNMFYGITEDHDYVRYVEELKNKEISCCHGGWLILRDIYTEEYTDDYSMLNILTMEKLQLPPLPYTTLCIDFAMSSSIMDRNCRIIFIERELFTFWSWQLGNRKFIERELTYKDGIIRGHITYKGKLYAVTTPGLNLIAFDFSDPDFRHEQVISGKSLPGFIFFPGGLNEVYLVESCEDILLICICIDSYSHEVSDVQVFKADLSIEEWVEMKTLGDRSILLGSCNNIFSSPAKTALGMKGNAIYWVSERHLYMYDIEDKSISTSLMLPIFGTSLYWVSFSNDEDKMSEQRENVSLIMKNFFYVQRGEATIKSLRRLQIEQRKIQNTEERETIGSSTMVRKETLWEDLLPKDLLLEIFSRLFTPDFRSVCRSWYSICAPPSRTAQKFLLPLKSYDFSSPLLMCPYNKAYNPIHGELYSMDFPDIRGAKVRATRDGWLLMEHNEYYLKKIYFYNPFTKEEIQLPSCEARFYYSVSFSAPPTSADCLVVVAAKKWDKTIAIYFKKLEDKGWTSRDIENIDFQPFSFSNCNPVVYKNLYYFLGRWPVGTLLIFNPKNDEVRVFKFPPDFLYDDKKMQQVEQQYMLESDDGKLIAIFVGLGGRSVYACEWNVSTSKWEILRSLRNKMVFVSRPLSVCKRATVSCTGNKIYFPRVVCDGQILFYSLASKGYHTFEKGNSYSNFSASKFYPEYNGWFMS